MTYAVIFASLTGNTKMLAEEIRKFIGSEQCCYFGSPGEAVKNENVITKADIIFAGFWTDKGTLSEDMKEFLRGLAGKEIFLFGTAGSGGSKDYYQRVLSRVKECISGDCIVSGTFMCQGKMPESVKLRYQAMSKKDPADERVKSKLENYEKALKHPDSHDMEELKSSLAPVSCLFR